MSNAQAIHFYDTAPEPEGSAPLLLEGLLAPQKSISPKYFYDERGSELFTEITRQPEYYPTRTEMGLLRRIAPELETHIGPDSVLVEYGSGNSEKIRILLENLRPRVYAPLDISREYLAKAAETVAAEFPWLEVRAACVDYSDTFELPPFDTDGRKTGFFPGSSIGNFSRPDAEDFLGRVRAQLGEDGGLLIGVDMKKSVDILNAAYNDTAGVTAAFNLNVLRHLNRQHGADFDLDQFEHHAAYNHDEGCVQMFLISKRSQEVSISGQLVRFEAGERIHTENSHKYSKEEFLAMAARAGFEDNHTWQDEKGWFSLFYLS